MTIDGNVAFRLAQALCDAAQPFTDDVAREITMLRAQLESRNTLLVEAGGLLQDHSVPGSAHVIERIKKVVARPVDIRPPRLVTREEQAMALLRRSRKFMDKKGQIPRGAFANSWQENDAEAWALERECVLGDGAAEPQASADPPPSP